MKNLSASFLAIADFILDDNEEGIKKSIFFCCETHVGVSFQNNEVLITSEFNQSIRIDIKKLNSLIRSGKLKKIK